MDFVQPAPGRDPVDDVLRAYFQAQLPHPWPDAPRPARALGLAARPARHAWPFRLTPQRTALAASLGLLFVGLMALAGRLAPAGPAPEAVTPNTASPRLVRPGAAREPARTPPTAPADEDDLEVLPNR